MKNHFLLLGLVLFAITPSFLMHTDCTSELQQCVHNCKDVDCAYDCQGDKTWCDRLEAACKNKKTNADCSVTYFDGTQGKGHCKGERCQVPQ